MVNTNQKRENEYFKALIPFDERDLFAIRGEERYNELSKLINGWFSELAKNICRDVVSENTYTLLYNGILGALLSLLPISNDDYRSILECVLEYKESTLCSKSKIIAEEMKNRQIGRGLSIAEIGGIEISTLMSRLGADVTTASTYYTLPWLNKYKELINIPEHPDKPITLEGYKHKFPGKYDFTVSNNVLTRGSRIEEFADGAFDRELEASIMELLAVFSNITKEGSYSIHGLADDIVQDIFLGYLGFKEIEWSWDKKAIVGQSKPLLLVKMEAKPELFPNGIGIGYKIIDFNQETNEFYIR